MRILLIHGKLERRDRRTRITGGGLESSPCVRFLASFRIFLFSENCGLRLAPRREVDSREQCSMGERGGNGAGLAGD